MNLIKRFSQVALDSNKLRSVHGGYIETCKDGSTDTLYETGVTESYPGTHGPPVRECDAQCP